MKSEDKPFIYVPPNADINLSANPKDPPKTEYEYRKFILNRKKILKVTASHAIRKESEESEFRD